jgi:outer membrane protein TolC
LPPKLLAKSIHTALPRLIVLGLLIGLWSGCASDLRDIDAKTDRVMREKVALVGGGAIAPERDWPARVETPPGGRSLVNKDPITTNPAARDLRFTLADEQRDIADRLARYEATDDVAAARSMGLPAVLAQAQLTARENLSAEEDYILSAIRLLVERHRFDIQLFASSGVTYNDIHTDGNRDLALHVVNTLAAKKQLPFGGSVAATWIWDAVENLRGTATNRYTQSSRLVLEGNIPLLRGFGDVAQEDLIQAERSMIYAARDFENFRRNFLVSLASDYFALLQQIDGIASQKRQLESLKQLEARQRSWYDAGRVPEFEVNLATNNVLSAQASLTNLIESHILTLDRFKVRLGLPVREPVRIDATDFFVPEPDTTLDRATDLALEYRLDLQNQRDRLDDSRRSVKNAQNNLLPDLNLNGAVALPTKAGAREGGSVYETDDAQYTATALLTLPLDRTNERLALRSSTIALARAQRDYDKFRDDLILDVRQKTREIERARLNLRLAEERVKINLRRKEEQDLKPDELDTQKQVDTANDIRNSERDRDQAKADLRNSVLAYLIATGQLRVQRNGQFEPLPGMKP